jgi:hypothetical protein
LHFRAKFVKLHGDRASGITPCDREVAMRRGFLIVVLMNISGMIRAGEDVEARKLLDQGINAMGGPVKIAKLETIEWKAKLSLEEGGQQIAVQLDGSFQGFDKFKANADVQVNGTSNNVLLVVNGAKAWIKDSDKVRELPVAESSTLHDVLFATRVGHALQGLKGKEYQLSHLGEITIGNQPALGLRIVCKDRPDVNLFFDKRTSLPVKSLVRLRSGQAKEIELEIFFSGFREVDGLKYFTGATYKADGKEIALEVTDLQFPERFDDGHFDRP